MTDKILGFDVIINPDMPSSPGISFGRFKGYALTPLPPEDPQTMTVAALVELLDCEVHFGVAR